MDLKAAAAGLACVVAFAAPAQAGMFGIGHVEPKAAPHGAWNFTSKPFPAYSRPALDDVSVVARCRYVAPREPFQWQFAFTNKTNKPMSFDVGLIQINTSRLATVGQKWTTVDPDSIRHVQAGPNRTVAIVENARLGCPGMQGGGNAQRHYIVALDNVTAGSQNIRHGVFDNYNLAVTTARADFRQSMGDAASAGMSAGIAAIQSVIDPDMYQVPY